MTRRFRSPTDPVERAGVPPEDPEGRAWARPAPLAWIAPGQAAATNMEMNVTLGSLDSAPVTGQLVVLGGLAAGRSAAATPRTPMSSPAAPSGPVRPAPPHQPARTLPPTPSRAYAAPALTGGTPRTQRIRVVALAGYPQQICGQLGGLWITQGHRGDNPVADRMTPAGAGRGERR